MPSCDAVTWLISERTSSPIFTSAARVASSAAFLDCMYLSAVGSSRAIYGASSISCARAFGHMLGIVAVHDASKGECLNFALRYFKTAATIAHSRIAVMNTCDQTQ